MLTERETIAAELIARVRGDGILAARVFVRSLVPAEVEALAVLQEQMAKSLAKNAQERRPLPADFADVLHVVLTAIADRQALEKAQQEEEQKKREALQREEAAAAATESVSPETQDRAA